ncbi:MAG: 30S ribosomal protein S8e [Nanoarchaeota archaeon]|nr:30S ribosomal protein S8e [Nanoarchaeota archaeon]
MASSQFRSKRKVSGKKYVDFRKKRTGDLGGVSTLTQIGKSRIKVKRVKGGNMKKSLLSDEFVCVNDGKKATKLKILSVDSNPANVNYTRRNIITKGAIVKTEKGDVKITSRPGQSGTLFGVFL